MRRGVDPDSIPRFEIPEQVYMDYDEEPATGVHALRLGARRQRERRFDRVRYRPARLQGLGRV